MIPETLSGPMRTMDETKENKAEAERSLSTIEKNILEAQVVEVIRTCYDPEIPVNIYEIGRASCRERV
jgi:metal-sulfur cluster biosynthetic enzyme